MQSNVHGASFNAVLRRAIGAESDTQGITMR